MFAVIFEVRPDPARHDTYLQLAGALRPELERIDGFIDNVRYRSRTRDGWLLSVSTWRDEKALVRWRAHAKHHLVQAQGRGGVLLDYHLRVGEVTRDSHPPTGHAVRELRFDETEVGAGTRVALVQARMPPADAPVPSADEAARRMGFDAGRAPRGSWDVFDAIVAPGDVVLLATLRDAAAADAFATERPLVADARRRVVRVIRDYGMFDRREAPQYHPEVARGRS